MITEFKLPELGENILSGTVVKIPVKAGDSVKKEDTVLEIEASKATIEVPSPVDGIIREIAVKEGQEIKVGQLIMKIETEGAKGAPEGKTEAEAPPPAQQAPIREQKAPVPPPRTAEEVAAAPSVRRLARERGVDISKVMGSGPAGRILEEDVLAYARGIKKEQPAPEIQQELLPDFAQWGEIECVPMGGTRLHIARHLSAAWHVIPHVTHFDKADVTELETMLKKYSTRERALTITPFLIKIAASALKLFPHFNASVDMRKREIAYKKYFHIGVAVDTEKGLVVPVIRDVDKKNIFAIADELKEVSKRARANKLTIAEMQGGCFTITNLGGIGCTSFAPIIHWPEAAILGVPRSRWEPLYIDKQFVPRKVLTFSLSFDHRIIDGAEAARFLRWICQTAEQPLLLELEG